MTTPVTGWEEWAPPLHPPIATGLPVEKAQEIADATWATDPHLCAALQWEWYAATLPLSQPVTAVSTGAQSVTYDPPAPPGEPGQALARAAWHRSLVKARLGSLQISDGGAWTGTDDEDDEDD